MSRTSACASGGAPRRNARPDPTSCSKPSKKAASGNCATAAVTQVEQSVPVAGVGQAVDVTDELVEVAEVDELLVLEALRQAATGTGVPTAPAETPGA